MTVPKRIWYCHPSLTVAAIFAVQYFLAMSFSSENIPFDRFGWFYDRNGSESYDGLFEMFTGEDDIYKVIHIF